MRTLGLILMLLCSFSASAKTVNVVLDTSMGEIELALEADKAPLTVENFLAYARANFYDGLIFHRVIPDFMIQAGGHDVLMVERDNPRPPIQNEANNGLSNVRGSVAMARQPQPHSARSQFFINLKDNAHLDHRSESSRGWGYAVFGRVVRGMDIVDAIADVETGPRSGHGTVPLQPIVINDVRVLEAKPAS